MDPVYVPLFSALAGAIIGSVSSIATLVVQARLSDRRNRMQQAVQLALEDHRASIELAKMRPPGSRVELPPITAYLHYHAEVLEVLERGPLTTVALRGIRERNKQVLDLAQELYDEANKAG